MEVKEDEETKLDMATGGISPEMEKIVRVLEVLGITPDVSRPEDVARLMRAFGDVKEEPPADRRYMMTDPARKQPGSFHYPKLSQFYGEEGKGEVSWSTFKFQVESLVAGKQYTEEQIQQGIRQALKGSAGDKLRRIGPTTTVKKILEKLESDYGTVESKESIMRKFYSCTQGPNETVEVFASRLEELFDKAVHLKAVERGEEGILKDVLHSGLRKELKITTLFTKLCYEEYDKFKRELRKIEEDQKSGENSEASKMCKAAVPPDRESKSEMSEIKQLLQQLHERIDVLEKEKEQPRYSYPQRGRGFPGTVRGRGFVGRGFRTPSRGRGFAQSQQTQSTRGRGDFKPSRPLGRRTFEPTCYFCNEKGHLQRNCPALNRVVCYNCNETGHISRNCPNA